MIIPVVNGMAHLDAMVERYGADRVCDGVATLAASMASDGTRCCTARTSTAIEPPTRPLSTPVDRIAAAKVR